MAVGSLVNGDMLTSANPLPIAVDRNSYSHIASATTTVVKNSPGLLHSIVVNTTAAGAITVYDNTAASGTVVAILKASVAEGTYLYDVTCTTGITVVTAAASDITVTYRA
jgi:bifunctional ADP-heptose synthase (sugar kinase/adenylyltransferase)